MKFKGFYGVLALWLYLLTSCAGQTTAPSTSPSPPSNITFTAKQTTIQPGECTVLRWEVTDGFVVTLDDQPVEKTGQMEVCPTETHVYELRVDLGTRMETRMVEIVVEGVGPVLGPGTAALRPGSVTPSQVTPGTPAYQAGTWVSTGGPIGGLGYDVRMDPRNPDVMYVTDAYAGVFKSTDGGKTWFAANNGLPAIAGASGDAIPVFSLTIDPNNPDTIWVGLQNSGGIYRSDDGGASWRNMNSGSNGILERTLSTRGFTIEPGNSNVVYFASEVPSVEWNGAALPGPEGLDTVKGVVYKTTNGGITWTRLWYGDNLARYIWINPQNHDLLYVSTGIFDRAAANGDPAAKKPGGVGILRSRDGGRTWEMLDQRNGIAADELYFGSLFMHPTNPNILIAASGNDVYHTTGGVYLTENGGDTWTKTLDAANMSAVEICISNPNVVYAGSRVGFYRSDDGGRNWTQLGQRNWGPLDAVAGFPIDMQCDPRNPMRIFVNNYGGGNFLSEDGGATWVVSSTGYTGALMAQIAVAPSDSAIVYASARSGLFASDDGGRNWRGLAYGAARSVEGKAMAVDPFNPQHIIATLGDGGLRPLVSEDGGRNWQMAGEVSGVWKVVFSPTVQNFVYAILERDGILLSRDGGLTWETTDNALDGENVAALTISLQDGALIYAGAFDGNIYRSQESGATWSLIAQNVGGGLPLTTLALDPFDPQKLYAGTDGGAVLISRDGGGAWQPSASGMAAETVVFDIAVDASHQNIVYAGTVNGVYVSLDGGSSWQALSAGLTIRAVRDLALSADGSVLYAATYGAGVWRLGTP